METSTLCQKKRCPIRSTPAPEAPFAAVWGNVVRVCCVADGTQHGCSRSQYEGQQRRVREAGYLRQRQQTNGHQQHWRLFQPERQVLAYYQRSPRYQNQDAHQHQQVHKGSQPYSRPQNNLYATHQNLAAEKHFLYPSNRETKHPAQLIMAILLLVVTAAERFPFDLSCAQSLLPVPPPAVASVLAAIPSFSRPEKEPALPNTDSNSAAEPAAPAGRLEDRRNPPSPPERNERHVQGAPSSSQRRALKDLSSMTKQDGRRGADEAAHHASTRVAGTEQAARHGQAVLQNPMRKAKAKAAMGNVYPQQPPSVTAGTTKIKTPTADISRVVASTPRDGQPHEVSVAAAARGAADERNVAKVSRSHSAAAQTASETVRKKRAAVADRDLDPKESDALQAAPAHLKHAATARASEGKETEENVLQDHSPGEPSPAQKQLAARNDFAGLYVPMNETTTSVDKTESLDAGQKLPSLLRSSSIMDPSTKTSANSATSSPASGSVERNRRRDNFHGASDLRAPREEGPSSTPSTDSSISAVAAAARGEPVSASDAPAFTAPAGSVEPSTSTPRESAAGAQSSALEITGWPSPLEASLTQAAKGRDPAAKAPSVETAAASRSSGEPACYGTKEPIKESRVLMENLVEQRVAALQQQTRSAERLIKNTADKQQRTFAAFEERVRAATTQLTEVQQGIQGLEKALAGLGELLAKERHHQEAMFQEDLRTCVDSIGFKAATLRLAEVTGKLNALHNMHDSLSADVRSLASRLEELEEHRQARLDQASKNLQNLVEGRTSLAIAQLSAEARQCAVGMQQLLNDAKLDQILVAQAAKRAGKRLRKQRFAAVDLSHVDESISFRGITSAFATLLQANLSQKNPVLIYFVTVRPERLASAAYANVFLVPSAENMRKLLSAVAADPSLSELVVKIESVMAEAWRIAPHRAHLQYLTPTPQEGLRVAGAADYVYEFMKAINNVIHEEPVDGELAEGRPCILVYTGMRQGVEAPADTPYTEFRKLQILRYLVTMYTSPVQETARLWQIMKNEVMLLDIFAPL